MRKSKIIIAVGLALLTPWIAPAFGQGPIKIGVMFPTSGPLAGQGVPSRNAVQLAFDEEKNVVAGRKIELLFEDSAGRPDTGLTKIKAFVERDKVPLLVSELVSSVGAAVAPYVAEKKIPWVNMIALSSLTRSLKSPYIFRFVPSAYQYAMAAAQWGQKHGWNKAYFIGWNAPPGREAADMVKKILGPENVVDAMFPNVGTPDYGPYITKMDPSKATGLFAAMWGVDSSRIISQLANYGMINKMHVLGIASFTSEEVLQDMPAQAVGVTSVYTYCGTLDTPENKKFVQSFKSNFHTTPGSYQYMSYMATRLVIQALKDINGRIEDAQAFIDALSKVQLKGPMGMASFDDHHGMVSDFYALHVEKGPDGLLQNKCGDRIAQVRDPYDLFP